MHDNEDFLMLSGIQHYFFCKRQWALIHVEQLWAENEYTIDGIIVHKNADDPYKKESRSNIFYSRAMPVYSKTLKFSGILDVVEFYKDPLGVEVPGKKDKWFPRIIEYKRGNEKNNLSDIMQLVAQTIALEETLNINITTSFLFYNQTKKKISIEITEELRQKAKKLSTEMHELYLKGFTPEAEFHKNCPKCSLIELCLPRITKKRRNIDNYILKNIDITDD